MQQEQVKMVFRPNIQLNLIKLARYIHVVIHNTNKIDEMKVPLYHPDLSLQQIFKQFDVIRKGYIDTNDIYRIVERNGADKKALQIEKIFRYFGATNNRITKNQFLKGVSLPSWKIPDNLPKSNDTLQKNFFRFLVCLYIAIEEDDAERKKLKDVNFEQAFQNMRKQCDVIRIDQLSKFLVERKFSKPDPFGLLRFMHNKIVITSQQFTKLFQNSLPQKFEQIDKEMNSIASDKNAYTMASFTNRYQKKHSRDSQLTFETKNQNQKTHHKSNGHSVIVQKCCSISNIFDSINKTSGLRLEDLIKKNNRGAVNHSFYE